MSLEVATNPFVGTQENGTYRTPVDLINSVLASNLSAIFGYKAYSQSDLLYNSLHSAPSAHFFQELDIRAGAGLAPLGYANTGSIRKPIGIIAPGYALPYFNKTLSSNENDKNIFFNVAALAYNDTEATLGNDYITPLSVARNLGCNVITPVDTNELELTALLSLAISYFQKSTSTIHLFDGINYSKTFADLPSTISNTDSILQNVGKKLSNNPSIDEILESFNQVTGKNLTNFDYSGAAQPEILFVTYGSIESELFQSLTQDDETIATLAVRIPLPFDTAKFVESIPTSVKKIVIIGQSINNNQVAPSTLRLDVSAALFYHDRKNIAIVEHLYSPDFVWSPFVTKNTIKKYVTFDKNIETNESKSFLFYLPDNSQIISVPAKLANNLVSNNNNVSFNTRFNNLVHSGVFQAQFNVSNKKTGILSNVDTADFTVVQDINMLNHLDIVNATKKNGTILCIDSTELEKFPKVFLSDLLTKEINLISIDPTGFIENDDIESLSVLIQSIFYSIVFDLPKDQILKNVVSTLSNEQVHDIINEDSANVATYTADNLPEQESSEETVKQLLSFVKSNAFIPNGIKEQQERISEVPSITTTPSELTKKLIFKEAYHAEKKLRPDLPLIKNHIIKVKENRRLTPTDYDRNIFHIEFDISDTDLTYDIGEALGIHARNNEAQILEFLNSYGLDPEQIIQIPNKDQPQFIESRTTLQAFVENLDIFGKPPKKFYESLIPFAKNDDEKKFLEDLISPGGALELKNFQEVEFYSYADIFQRFPSVRPELGDLLNLIAPLKRREYSIASSQKVHPNEIHLLIVVVDWIDKQGRKRYGQASKYISDLQVGQELVVSIKPSVMKLPADPKAPVIMSGLGTGLAPFKAIVEEKLWQKQNGYEIGDIFLYLGSRHCREEYLYGEIWEAYKDAGIITHIGAAFSRDQTKKIYIQDRIRENLDELKVAIIDQRGSFFLCGPTWPVPDITAAIEDIIAADAKERNVKVDLNEAIEELKEASRYILEVY